MNIKSAFINTAIFSLLGLSSMIAVADDTEVYLGNSLASTVQPNLVFIIDTSGSMRNDVTLTTGSYDPSITYSGSCNTSRLYYSTRGTPPSCGTSDYINLSSFVCAAARPGLSTTGYYAGAPAARYHLKNNNHDFWDGLSSNNHTELVECKADWGVHGKTDASTNLYPADYNRDDNSDPGYRANTSNAINWDNTGGTYTFYSANYLNWLTSPGTTTTKTRLQIVQEVFSNLMDSVNGINVSVMRYDDASGTSNHGGYFVMPMQPLGAANRQSYKDAVNALTANGNTPLSETLYESYLFYKGAAVKFGNATTPGTNADIASGSVLDPTNTANYKTPIEYSCQKNFVILLTDGDPTGPDTDADADIEALPGFSVITGAASCVGNCLDELADYMNSKDCSGLTDTQNVITYTIGFTTNQILLNDAATKGGGEYYTADDTAGLTNAFTAILTDIMAINTTFIAPAVSVNAFNRFTHRDELYYALFKPNARPNWNGNIKRFKLAGDPPILVDANNLPAIDANTGFFKTDATSYWTLAAEAPDGDRVEEGGSSSIQALPRVVYTYTGAAAPNNAVLSDVANALHETNMSITKAMLGDAAMTDALRTDTLQWARGVDVLDDNSNGNITDTRRHMGDPLHAKPLLITYGGTDAAPDMTLYTATNEGYLHAINTTDGSEVFSFMPQQLLGNLPTLYDNVGGTTHPYGLDGQLTSWFNDLNNNGMLYNASNTLEAGEFVYLYQGMRRGGKNYYALDVTDRDHPKLKWRIEGGSGEFSELAQTWSAAIRTKIKLGGVSKNVLIFGGGYDPSQDTIATAQNDAEGRAIYIVDAETGAKIWQAGPAGSGNASGSNPNLVLADMTNSIPSDVRFIDINMDGYADVFYVGDMRGQLWRFDINNSSTSASNLVTGAVIASLGSANAEDNRRFYYAPDVSLSSTNHYINIAIGSGYRAHPLDTVIHDAFYVIRDFDAYAPPADGNADGIPDYVHVTINDLYDATANLIGQGTSAEITAATSALEASSGWYILLQEVAGNASTFIGEKVLASSITIGGTTIFTTYAPVASASGTCSPSQGIARTYLVYTEDAKPVADLNHSGGDTNGDGVIDEDDYTREDRIYDLLRGGIPPGASIIFHNGELICLIGTEKCPDPALSLTPQKIFWFQH
jgi:type IV pilus assembly protein PilY1